MSKRKRVNTISKEGESDLESPASGIQATQKKVRWDGNDEFDVGETDVNEGENAEEESQVGQKVSPGVITARDLHLTRARVRPA